MKIKSFNNLNIRQKLMITFMLIISVFFIGIIFFVSFKSKDVITKGSIEFATATAKQYSNLYAEKLNLAMRTVEVLAGSCESSLKSGRQNRQDLMDLMRTELDKNNDILAVWTIWEPNAFDGKDSLYRNSPGHDATGRFVACWDRSSVKIRLNPNPDYDTPGANDFYIIPKMNKQPTILEPVKYSYSGSKNEERFICGLVVPVINDGEFVGLMGIDYNMDRLQEINSQIKFYTSGFGKLLSHKGIVAADQTREYLGKTTFEFADKQTDIINTVTYGKEYTTTIQSKSLTKETIKIYTPINIIDTNTPWSFCLLVPVDEVLASATSTFWLFIIIIAIVLLVIAFVINYLSHALVKPINDATSTLKNLAKGQVDIKKRMEYDSGDELGQMATALNTLMDGLVRTTEFAKQIGEGKFDSEFQLLSENDSLGNALLEMRGSLINAATEEKLRKEEEAVRAWTTQGVAKFADILRQRSENISEMASSIISNLVEYIDAIQSGLFIYNDDNADNKFLELVAAYAYHRKKYLKKEINLGEELVGSCALEKKTIYLTDIPENYIQITSGLGQANPRNLLIVPLKIEEDIFGVLEIASFHIFKQFQIEFIEKIAESIASTLSNIKTAERTARLLNQSRQQAEAMAAQEEEMRQNLEELQATQEEMNRRNSEIQALNNAVDAALISVIFNTDGSIARANQIFLDVYGFHDVDLMGKRPYMLIAPSMVENFKIGWSKVLQGQQYQSELKGITKNGEEIWLHGTYSPIRDQAGVVTRVYYLAQNITDNKRIEFEAKQQAVDLENSKKEIDTAYEKLKLNESVLKKAVENGREKERQINLMRDNLEKKVKEQTHDLMIKNSEMLGLTEAVDEALMRAEYAPDGTILKANDNYVDTVGVSRENFIGKPVTIFVADADLASFNETWSKVMAGKTVKYEAKRKLKTNEDARLLTIYRPALDENGQVHKIFYIGLDMTASRNQSPEAKRDSDEHARG